MFAARAWETLLGGALGLAAATLLFPLRAQTPTGVRDIEVVAGIDTPIEVEYYRHGGILPYVLRELTAS